MKFTSSRNKYKSIYNTSQNNQNELEKKSNDILKYQSLPLFQKKNLDIYNSEWLTYATIPFTYSVVTKSDLLPAYIDIIYESPELTIPDAFIPFVTVDSIFKSIPNTIITPLAEYQTSIWQQLRKITADSRVLYRSDENGTYYYDTLPGWTTPINQLLAKFLSFPEQDELTVVFPSPFRPSNIYWDFNTGGYPKKVSSDIQIQSSNSQNITFWKVKENTYIIRYRTKIYCLQRAEKTISSDLRVENDTWTKDGEDELLYHRTSTSHQTITKNRYETESSDIQVKLQIKLKNPLEVSKTININDKI